MPGMTGSFDATQFAPKQIGTSHPVGKKFPAQITNTSIEPTKDQTGGMFIVEFATPQGTIPMRYNLWNQNAKAVEIAHGQLSALLHCIGIFRIQFENEGAAIRGARCCIDVDLQNKSEPDGYTQVSRVYDANGNEPGKASPQAQPQQQPQPIQQQSEQPIQQPQWGSPQPNAPTPNAAPSWQPPGVGQAPPAAPPWGKQ